MTKNEQINEVLTRGVVEIIDRENLEKKLRSKKPLIVKLGIDPTSPNIHIGRAVVLWKLRAFQNLGHEVAFIVGDFTGQIGDTSDKEAERPQLSEEQIQENLKTYFNQAFKVLDKNKTKTHYNSKWLKKLGFLEIGSLAGAFGLHEFSARENIAKRLNAGKRVSLKELLYPLMQGYDSVAVKSSVELGGSDQKFNVLAGRTIQKLYGQEPQDVLITEILEGTDGRKMSSSWGNVINLTDKPDDMFGKVMSIDDSLIEKYFTLATTIPLSEVKNILRGNPHPRDQKLMLASAITDLYHPGLGDNCLRNFIDRFTNKELPENIPSLSVGKGKKTLVEILVKAKFAASNTEARRLLEQNGVKVNGSVAKARDTLEATKNPTLLQVGKRKIANIII